MPSDVVPSEKAWTVYGLFTMSPSKKEEAFCDQWSGAPRNHVAQGCVAVHPGQNSLAWFYIFTVSVEQTYGEAVISNKVYSILQWIQRGSHFCEYGVLKTSLKNQKYTCWVIRQFVQFTCSTGLVISG